MASTRFTQQHIIELNEKPASSLLMNKELQNIYKGTNELDDEAKIHRAKQADPTLADTAPEKHVTNAQAKKWDDIANTFSGVSPSSFVAATEVVTTATANKILKLNADGKLPTDIVGNATTASDSLLLNGKSDTAFQAVAEKYQPGGYAGLDAEGKIPCDITGNAATSSLAVNATYWNGRRLLDKASTTQPIGLVLVEPGGGAGFWDWVDLDGNPVMPPPGYFSSRPEYQISVSMVDDQAMVEISQFYFLVKTLPSGPYAGKQARFINKTAFSGAKLHPAFLNGGVEISSFYIGAYEAFGDGETKAGSSVKKPPLVSIDFPTMVSRCNARNASGVTGFSLIDIYQIAAIQMLAHVEMGTTDSQSVFGRGNCDSPVPYASGGWALSTGYTNAIWRGIHELWGNTWCMVQGLENRDGAIWVWDSGGGKSFVNTGEVFPYSGYPTEMHVASGANFDLSALYLPKTTISSQDNGTYSDYFWITKDGTTKVCYHGGGWDYGSLNGLFDLYLCYAASNSYSNIGGRLAKV